MIYQAARWRKRGVGSGGVGGGGAVGALGEGGGTAAAIALVNLASKKSAGSIHHDVDGDSDLVSD